MIAADSERIELARTLVEVTARRGWGERSLREASQLVTRDPERWRRVFPKGARDAIWFISEVSDASMKAAFEASSAANLRLVIAERFAQNNDLKPFVRRVMLFDILHPLQALARMQRTARQMVECLALERRNVSDATLSVLNVTYTLIVFVWLIDRTTAQSLTRRTTNLLMQLLKL